MHVPFCDPNRLRPTCNFSQASRFISSRKSLHPAVGCVFLSVFSPRSVKPHSLISYVRESPLLRALPVIPFPQPQALFQGSNPVAEFDLHRAVVCHYSRASKAIDKGHSFHIADIFVDFLVRASRFEWQKVSQKAYHLQRLWCWELWHPVLTVQHGLFLRLRLWCLLFALSPCFL